jgi:lambda family phage minor tail protein L
MSNISSHRQLLDLGNEVTLMQLDLNPIGVAEVYYFCNDLGVSFNGQPYEQVPFEITDIEKTVTGETSPAKISLPNSTKFVSQLVLTYKDAIGAEVTKIKTFEKFLDGQPTADGTAILSMDVFVLEQKVGMNKVFGQWELRVLADTGDRYIPGRLAMKDICPYGYRKWDAVNGVWVYPKLKPCPYASNTVLMTIDNVATADKTLDACDHRVDGGCKARAAGWPSGTLGFGGYPGMSRYRVG